MPSHIQLESDPNYRRVIVCGSPERAELISTSLDGAKALKKNREYHSYLGQYQKKNVLVMSHGVGSAGAAICFQELINVGAKTIIRIGTAGGLTDQTQIGDLVIPIAAIRKDGVSSQMVPPQYPAVPDFALTSALIRACNTAKLPFTSGIVLTSDLFYDGLLDSEFQFYKKANAIAVEMECSTLFIIGQIRGIKTASILALDGNPLKWAEGLYNPQSGVLEQSIKAAIKTTLDVITSDEAV